MTASYYQLHAFIYPDSCSHFFVFFCLFQLYQTIGSIEAIAKSSKEYILETTDLSPTTAETITRFFRDPKFYLGPKIGWVMFLILENSESCTLQKWL